MTQNFNPYAPPSTSLEAAPLGGVWRDNDVVVLTPQAALPCRCVKCNEPVDEPTKERKIYWHHPAIYILVLINIFIYAIVALIVRKTATINPGLCKAHRSKRNIAIAGGWAGSIIGIVLGIACLAFDGCGFATLGWPLFLGSTISAVMRS